NGGDTDDGAVQIVETFFVDDGGDLAGDAAGLGVLVQDDDLVRAAHTGDDGGAIEREQRAQVNDLELDTVFRQRLGRLDRHVHHGGISNDGEVAAGGAVF